MASKDKPTRLSALMDHRRVELRLKWDQVADSIGISAAHLRRVRNNESAASPLVVAGIERALRWAAGSIAAIEADGDPTPLPDDGMQRRLGVAPPVVADYPRDVAGHPFLERIWDDPYAPEDQRRAAVDGVIAHLSRARESRGAARGEGKGLHVRNVR